MIGPSCTGSDCPWLVVGAVLVILLMGTFVVLSAWVCARTVRTMLARRRVPGWMVSTSGAIVFLAAGWLAIRLLAIIEALRISVWVTVIGTGTGLMLWVLLRYRQQRP